MQAGAGKAPRHLSLSGGRVSRYLPATKFAGTGIPPDSLPVEACEGFGLSCRATASLSSEGGQKLGGRVRLGLGLRFQPKQTPKPWTNKPEAVQTTKPQDPKPMKGSGMVASIGAFVRINCHESCL